MATADTPAMPDREFGWIKAGFVGLVGVIALIVAIVVTISVHSAWIRQAEARHAARVAAYANILLDELDRERSEAIHFTAVAQTMSAPFEDRAEATQESVSAFTDAVATTPAAQRSPERVQAVITALELLEVMRADIADGAMPPRVAAEGYTGVSNAVMEGVSALLARLAPDMTELPHAFHQLAALRDRAGLETGIGMVAFEEQGMSPDLHALFLKAIADQRELAGAVRTGEEPYWRERLLDLFDHANDAEIRAAREALRRTGYGEPLNNTHREAWLRLARERDSDLAVLRNRFVQDQLETVRMQSEHRIARRFTIGVVMLLALFAGSAIILGMMHMRKQGWRRGWR